MEKLKFSSVFLIIFFAFVIVMIGFFIFQKPEIIGLVVCEEAVYVKNWTFDNVNDYTYDSPLITLADEEVKLVKTIAEYTWNVDNFTDIYLISALEYEPDKKIHSRTSKVQSLDGEGVDVHKDKEIFDVTFEKEISNNDIISLYILKDEDDDNQSTNIKIYLCSNGTFCNESNYGLINFNSTGWYNLTIIGLSVPTNIFNINPSKNVKFDYIKAIHKDVITFKSINISYPKSASIETKDSDVPNLFSFLSFNKNDVINEQNITYYHSTDSGNNWFNMPNDGNLSSVSTANKKIRIKAKLSSNGSTTPIVYDFGIIYKTQLCKEDWNLTYGECLSNDKRLKYYIDKNSCGTINSLPSDNGTFETCDYDNNAPNVSNLLINPKTGNVGTIINISMNIADESEIISVLAQIQNPDENIVKTISLLNISKGIYSSFFDTINMNEGIYFVDILASDLNNNQREYENIGLIALTSYAKGTFTNNSLFLRKDEKSYIEAKEANAVLEITSKADISEASISIVHYSKNLRNSTPSLNELGKYVDIAADNAIKQNLFSVTIKIYYTDEEIANSGLDEESLKIHYFNETSNQWQVLNSTVNTSGNYIEVTIGHLSTFGIFGEKKKTESQAPSSGSSSSSSGGGGGGGTTPTTKPEQLKVPEEVKKEIEKEIIETKIESQEIKQECNYKISVTIPEHISFIEQDYIKGLINNVGNCEIESLNIYTSSELKDIVKIENESIKKIKGNESIEFLLIKKLIINESEKSLIQGFIVKTASKNIETYNGSINFDALTQNKSFKERLNISIDVLKPAKSSLNQKVLIFAAVSLLLIISVFYIYGKIKKRNETNL